MPANLEIIKAPAGSAPKTKAVIEGLALERPLLPIRSICRQVRQFARLQVSDFPATVPSRIWFVKCPVAFDSGPQGSKAYGESFDLVPDARQHEQMPSGRQTMPSFLFICFVRMGKPLDHG